MTRERSFGAGLTPRQLLEIDACTQCGECLKHCPVQQVTGNPAISPPEKIRLFREFLRATDGLKARLVGPAAVDPRLLEDFTKAVYECTTCGACGQNCPVGIFTQRLWPTLRKEMVKRGLGPLGPQPKMPGAIERTGNPYDKPAVGALRPLVPRTRPGRRAGRDRLLRRLHRRLRGAADGARRRARAPRRGRAVHDAAPRGGSLLRLPAVHHRPARAARGPGAAARRGLCSPAASRRWSAPAPAA